jgi:uncharacterized membrane protein
LPSARGKSSSTKGARWHRALGFVYLSLMTITAVAAFFIRSVGHKWAMLGLYFGGLLIAGSLTFMPGRLMHQLVFGLVR